MTVEDYQGRIEAAFGNASALAGLWEEVNTDHSIRPPEAEFLLGTIMRFTDNLPQLGEVRLEKVWEERLHPRDRRGRFAEAPGLAIRVPAAGAEFDPWGGVVHAVDEEGEKQTYHGKIASPEDLPPYLYHVTAHVSAVRESGFLTVGRGGGLGAFGSEKSVSLTTSREGAERWADDMRRNIRLAHEIPEPPPSAYEWGKQNGTVIPSESWKQAHPGSTLDEWVADRDAIEERRVSWGLGVVDVLEREAAEDGWSFRRHFTDEQLREMARSYDWHDWLNYFYGFRPEELGGDPVFLFLDQADQAGRDPAEIGVVQVETPAAFDTGALVLNLGGGLEEVRIYGDVPVSTLQKAAWREELHPRDSEGRFASVAGFSNWLGERMHPSAIHRRGYGPAPATILVSTSQPDMETYADGALGRLLVPQNRSRVLDSQKVGVPFAVDNGGFWGVDEDEYKTMCQALHDEGAKPLWVTAPDVLIHPDDGGPPYGDAKGTVARFEQWEPYLRHLGLPAALVAQDGMDSPEMLDWLDRNWDRIACVFIGGSDEFKLGPGGARLVELAHEHGKLVHVGRVNTLMRVAYVRDVLGADSFDGKQWAQFKVLKLRDGLRFVGGGTEPPTKIGREWVQAAHDALHEGSPWPRPPGRQRPQWPRGFFEPVAKQLAETALYYQDLCDALYGVGLSDYWHLDFTPGETGITITLTDERQIGWLRAWLPELGEPELDHELRASWPTVELRPGEAGEWAAEQS